MSVDDRRNNRTHGIVTSKNSKDASTDINTRSRERKDTAPCCFRHKSIATFQTRLRFHNNHWMVMVKFILSAVLLITHISISAAFGESRCPTTRLLVDTSEEFITSPSHLNYSEIDCTWMLQATRDEWTIKFTVLRSQLDEGVDGDCTESNMYLEFMELKYREPIGYVCGTQTPTFYSSTKRVMIRLKSTSPLTRQQGFKIKYSAGIFRSVGDEIIPTSTYYVKEDPQVFSQPIYSSRDYPMFVKKAWLITSENQDQEIYVKALELALPKETCVFEYIEVFKGDNKNSPSVGKWCASDTPDMVITQGNIFIILHIRNFERDTKFKIEYGIHEKNAIPMIAGIFVGVIVLIGVVYISARVICSRYMNNDDDDDDEESDTVTGSVQGNQTLLTNVSTRDNPPSFSELPPAVPSAPPAGNMTPPPPSYQDVIDSPLRYNKPS